MDWHRPLSLVLTLTVTICKAMERRQISFGGVMVWKKRQTQGKAENGKGNGVWVLCGRSESTWHCELWTRTVRRYFVEEKLEHLEEYHCINTSMITCGLSCQELGNRLPVVIRNTTDWNCNLFKDGTPECRTKGSGHLGSTETPLTLNSEPDNRGCHNNWN